MKLQGKVVDFIMSRMDLIRENRFERLYLEWANQQPHVFSDLDAIAISDLTETLWEAGIDPLPHMSYIPIGFAYGLRLPKEFTIPPHIQYVAQKAFYAVSGCDEIRWSVHTTCDVKAFDEAGDVITDGEHLQNIWRRHHGIRHNMLDWGVMLPDSAPYNSYFTI